MTNLFVRFPLSHKDIRFFVLLAIFAGVGGAMVGCGGGNAQAIKPEQIAPRPPEDSAATGKVAPPKRSDSD